MRSASTGPESALLKLKVSRWSLSLLCANMSGLGGRGTLFNEILFESRFESTAFSKYDDPPCRDCSLDESNEALRAFLFMLSWSVVDVLFVIHDGCCDGIGWNVSDSHCWSKLLGSSEWNNLQQQTQLLLRLNFVSLNKQYPHSTLINFFPSPAYSLNRLRDPNDGDGNEHVNNPTGVISKTTTALHMNHACLSISLSPLHICNMYNMKF